MRARTWILLWLKPLPSHLSTAIVAEACAASEAASLGFPSRHLPNSATNWQTDIEICRRIHVRCFDPTLPPFYICCQHHWRQAQCTNHQKASQNVSAAGGGFESMPVLYQENCLNSVVHRDECTWCKKHPWPPELALSYQGKCPKGKSTKAKAKQRQRHKHHPLFVQGSPRPPNPVETNMYKYKYPPSSRPRNHCHMPLIGSDIPYSSKSANMAISPRPTPSVKALYPPNSRKPMNGKRAQGYLPGDLNQTWKCSKPGHQESDELKEIPSFVPVILLTVTVHPGMEA